LDISLERPKKWVEFSLGLADNSMKVFRILQLLVLGLAAFLMQGCPPLGSTEFINNTGRPITIHYAEKTVSVVQGASTTIRG